MAGTQITVNGQNKDIIFQAFETAPATVIDGGSKPLRVAGNIIDSIRDFGGKVPAAIAEASQLVEGGFNNAEALAPTEAVLEVVDTMPVMPQTEGVPEVVAFEPTVTDNTLPVSEPTTVPDIFGMASLPSEPVVIPEVVSEISEVTSPVLEVVAAPMVAELPESGEQVEEAPDLAPVTEEAVAAPMVAELPEPSEQVQETPDLEPVAFNLHKIEAPLAKEVSEDNLADDFENKSNNFLESFAEILTTIAEMQQKIESQGKMLAALQAKEQVQAIPEPIQEPVQLIPEQPGMVRQMGSGIDMAA